MAAVIQTSPWLRSDSFFCLYVTQMFVCFFLFRNNVNDGPLSRPTSDTRLIFFCSATSVWIIGFHATYITLDRHSSQFTRSLVSAAHQLIMKHWIHTCNVNSDWRYDLLCHLTCHPSLKPVTEYYSVPDTSWIISNHLQSFILCFFIMKLLLICCI